jgi:Icc-related predicted phosphoesterase
MITSGNWNPFSQSYDGYMKILTVSDRVEPILNDSFDTSKFSGIDLIFSCGDLPPEYLTLISTRVQAPLFYVKGNHDIRYDLKPPDGCINIHGKLTQFQGFNILGLEGSRWYNGGPNQYTERQMRRIVRNLKIGIWWKGGIDLVVTHAPPRHVHDAEDRCHKGFKSFQWLINRYAPEYFIHGHIHAHFDKFADRLTVIENTKVINSYGYTILEINI